MTETGLSLGTLHYMSPGQATVSRGLFGARRATLAVWAIAAVAVMAAGAGWLRRAPEEPFRHSTSTWEQSRRIG